MAKNFNSKQKFWYKLVISEISIQLILILLLYVVVLLAFMRTTYVHCPWMSEEIMRCNARNRAKNK